MERTRHVRGRHCGAGERHSEIEAPHMSDVTRLTTSDGHFHFVFGLWRKDFLLILHYSLIRQSRLYHRSQTTDPILSRNICVWQLANHPHCYKPHPPPPLCRSHCPAKSRRSFALLLSTMKASNTRRVRQPATMPTCAADPTRYQGCRPDPEEAPQPW